jgi:hypothetical protein
MVAIYLWSSRCGIFTMLLTHSELQHSLLVIEILPSTKVMYAKTYSKKKFLCQSQSRLLFFLAIGIIKASVLAHGRFRYIWTLT